MQSQNQRGISERTKDQCHHFRVYSKQARGFGDELLEMKLHYIQLALEDCTCFIELKTFSRCYVEEFALSNYGSENERIVMGEKHKVFHFLRN